jgi:hypothetical protein
MHSSAELRTCKHEGKAPRILTSESNGAECLARHSSRLIPRGNSPAVRCVNPRAGLNGWQNSNIKKATGL